MTARDATIGGYLLILAAVVILQLVATELIAAIQIHASAAPIHLARPVRHGAC